MFGVLGFVFGRLNFGVYGLRVRFKNFRLGNICGVWGGTLCGGGASQGLRFEVQI